MSISDINKGASGVNPTASSILPSQTGNSGKVLGTDGASVSWVTGTVFNNEQSGSIIATAISGIVIYEFTGAGSLTLPTAIGNTAIFMIKNKHIANITVTFTSGQNADGSTSISISPYQALQFVSNNTNYNIF